ncbi:MAG TPA: DNA repair protein RecO [Sedimentisphaerales bacterium]|nr:DNA repair protein RecO [Sedimentisphaerales bacterium]
MLRKDEAVCIRAIDYSDTSQVVTLFCRQAGKISAIAKGSKRPKSPFGGPVELLSHGMIVYTDRPEARLSSLTEFGQQGGFIGLRRQLATLNAALFAVELLNALTTDNDPYPHVFDDLLRFLGDLDSVCGDIESLRLLVVFQAALLGGLGMGLTLDRCANCSSKYDAHWPLVFFSTSAGGILCRNCEGSFPDRISLSRQAGACLGDMRFLGGASDAAIREVEKVIIFHFTAILHHPPRMARYFLSA